MEIGDYSNTPCTSSDSFLTSLETEVEQSGQAVYIQSISLAEELVKHCFGINVSNITSKAESLKKFLEENDDICRRWLAQHLVLKWIPYDQNHHFLFHTFFNILNDQVMNDYIKEETFRCINLLLKSKTKREFSMNGDRAVLQNFGHWLGLLTIASNVPILHTELDFAGLLLFAYTSGEQELYHITPFVAEVIMSSTKSHIFKPNCSWLRPIYRLFADMLRFCRQLHGTLDLVNSDDELRDIIYLTHANQQIAEIGGIADAVEAQLIEDELEVPLVTARTPHHLPSTYSAPKPVDSPRFYFHEINLFDEYETRVDLPSFSFFRIFPALEHQTRQLFAKVVMQNIKDTCNRSFPMSIPLSLELIKLYLPQFHDDQELRITALTTVRSFTSAIALLQTREFLPSALLVAIQELFNQYIQQFENPEQSMLDMAAASIDIIIEKNLEYAICYVIKSVCNQAMSEMDQKIRGSLQTDSKISKETILPKVQEMLDKLPPQLSHNLTAEELCNVFPNHIFGFKQPLATANDDVNKWNQNDFSKSKPAIPIDPSILKKKFESVFHDWITLCYKNETPSFSDLLSILRKHEVMLSEQSIPKLIKVCIKTCADASYNLLAENSALEAVSSTRGLAYFIADAFIKLDCIVIKNGDTVGVSNYQILQESLETISHIIVTDHDLKQLQFNGLPFLRILIRLLEEFTPPKCESSSENNEKVLDTFIQVLMHCQPRRAPAFCFHWLEIIGHRKFIRAYLCSSKSYASSSASYEQLLITLIKFLAPSLSTPEVTKSVLKLYEGILRLMVILLHDFPDFYCQYYFTFCDAIPATCVQLRNIVLCAFPSDMKPPDPFTVQFNTLHNCSDMQNIPELSTQIFGYVPADAQQLVNFHANQPQEPIISELVKAFRNETSDGMEYNVPLLNAFVSFVGFRAASFFKETNQVITVTIVGRHASVNIFKLLAELFCSEALKLLGRYLLFNALINQLRYPSAITHFFACTVLNFFRETNNIYKEQITHILFERLAAFRPFPWGLSITFIELIKNSQYNFWTYDFVNRYSDIRTLLVNIARKCNILIPAEYMKK